MDAALGAETKETALAEAALEDEATNAESDSVAS